MREHSGRTLRVVVLALLLALALAISGCGQAGRQSAAGDSAGSAAETGGEITEVRLGAVFALTGKEARPGGYFKQATELLVNKYNAQGGLTINGKKVPIRLIILDDTTDPTKSAQLVEQLITQEKVHAIIGGYSSNLVQAQSVVPDRYGIPYVNGGGAATDIYGRSKWVFGTLSPVEMLAETQMRFLKDLIDQGKLPKPTKISLAWENTSHGKDYQKGVRNMEKAHPDYFQVVLDEGFELHGSDYGSLLTKVKNARADVFLVDAHLEDYITMHRQYTQMGLYHKMVTYGARGSEAAARDGLGAATDYIFASAWWTEMLPYPQVKAFVQEWEQAYGQKPAWYGAIGYEGARTLLTAIENAGSVDPEKIRQALVSLEITDAIFPGQVIKFTETGQAKYPFVVTQNKPGGGLDIVYPADAATGEVVAPIPQR